MSVASEITRLQNAKASIKTSIENKGVTVPSSATLDTYDDYIDAIQQGGGSTEAEEKDINFYDYDGTRLYSYTLSEFNNVTALPALPEQDGLTCQGWNWTLAQIKAENQPVDVGAMYVTTDGATKIYISLKDSNFLTVTYNLFATGIVNIDWGDGNVEAVSGIGTASYSAKGVPHTYSQIGNYVIKITNGNQLAFWGSSVDNVSYMFADVYHNNCIEKIEIGSKPIIIGDFAFANLHIDKINLPTNITSMGDSIFNSCHYLKCCVWPSKNTFTSITDLSFSGCTSVRLIQTPYITEFGANCLSTTAMKRLVFGNNITTLGSGVASGAYAETIIFGNSIATIPMSACQNNKRLKKAIFGSGLTRINNQVFYNCNGAAIFDFRRAQSVPVLPNAYTFNKTSSLKKFIVPDSLYEDWIAATNWDTYASSIVKESDYND